MNNKYTSELNKDDTPWYVRLILGIVYTLFAITCFSIYYYIIKQLAGLVSSWIEANFRLFFPGCLLPFLDTFRTLVVPNIFLLLSPKFII